MENKGINWTKELAERDGTEYKHLKGISPVSIFAIPVDLREKYLPKGELQNIGEEKMDCVSRAVCNWCESELNYACEIGLVSKENKKWLENSGYVDEEGRIVLSDVWVAIGSGTTREGNSLKAPIDFARKNGMIPKKLLPQLNGFDENYNPDRVTDKMRKLGAEFFKRFTIGYEQVAELQFSENTDGVVVALYAWTEPVNGVYPKTDLGPTHSVYRFVKIVNHSILDNYDIAGVFIKHLAKDFNFMDYGYRLYFISQQNLLKKNSWWLDIVQILKSFFRRGLDPASLGAARSSKWNKIRDEFLGRNPLCSVCERKNDLIVHHQKPFHIYPDLELRESNLVVLCESAGMNCHITFGHLGNFKNYNPNVLEDIKLFNKKVKERL